MKLLVLGISTLFLTLSIFFIFFCVPNIENEIYEIKKKSYNELTLFHRSDIDFSDKKKIFNNSTSYINSSKGYTDNKISYALTSYNDTDTDFIDEINSLSKNERMFVKDKNMERNYSDISDLSSDKKMPNNNDDLTEIKNDKKIGTEICDYNAKLQYYELLVSNANSTPNTSDSYMLNFHCRLKNLDFQIKDKKYSEILNIIFGLFSIDFFRDTFIKLEEKSLGYYYQHNAEILDAFLLMLDKERNKNKKNQLELSKNYKNIEDLLKTFSGKIENDIDQLFRIFRSSEYDKLLPMFRTNLKPCELDNNDLSQKDHQNIINLNSNNFIMNITEFMKFPYKFKIRMDNTEKVVTIESPPLIIAINNASMEKWDDFKCEFDLFSMIYTLTCITIQLSDSNDICICLLDNVIYLISEDSVEIINKKILILAIENGIITKAFFKIKYYAVLSDK